MPHDYALVIDPVVPGCQRHDWQPCVSGGVEDPWTAWCPTCQAVIETDCITIGEVVGVQDSALVLEE